MNIHSQTVCIFPDILPRAEILFPLVQVFQPIVYLRPVEEDTPPENNLSLLCKEMIEQGLLSFECPAPLHDDRERFLSLVSNIQEHRDDYAGQLGRLSLAGLGKKAPESKTSIMGALLKQSGITDPKDEQRDMILWQARLLLKLGEFFDLEQEELQKNLHRISALEQGLIVELREEKDQPFSLTEALSRGGGSSDGQLRLRLKAWSRLFGLGNCKQQATTFITTSRDALELLLDKDETDTEMKHVSSPLLSLELPGGRETENFTDHLNAFQQDAADLLEILSQTLTTPQPLSEEQKKILNGPTSDWATLLDKHYPKGENTRLTLHFYLVPNVNPKKLFLETFGRDEDDLKIPDTGRQTDILLALLEETEGI